MSHWGQPPTSAPEGAPQSAWGPAPQQPYAAWPPAPYDAAGSQALRTARTALGWAVGATIAAVVAVAIAVASLLVGVGPDAGGDANFAYEPLRDQVEGFEDGEPLAGPELVGMLRDLLGEAGVESEDIAVSCPDTASVSVSTVVVCSGEVDGFLWTGVVLFETVEGTFVVLET